MSNNFTKIIKKFFFILLFICSISNAQKNEKIVNLPYLDACLVINEIPKDYRVPYEIVDLMLFENDTLFENVRYIEVNNKSHRIPECHLSTNMIRIELLDHAKCIYLLNKDKKVLAACYPNESNFEVQWYSNGKNSALKQREMNTVNINYYYGESMENTYISYDEIVLKRRIDKDETPEDFELNISYFDKDSDGTIEHKAPKTIIQ